MRHCEFPLDLGICWILSSEIVGISGESDIQFVHHAVTINTYLLSWTFLFHCNNWGLLSRWVEKVAKESDFILMISCRFCTFLDCIFISKKSYWKCDLWFGRDCDRGKDVVKKGRHDHLQLTEKLSKIRLAKESWCRRRHRPWTGFDRFSAFVNSFPNFSILFWFVGYFSWVFFNCCGCY